MACFYEKLLINILFLNAKYVYKTIQNTWNDWITKKRNNKKVSQNIRNGIDQQTVCVDLQIQSPRECREYITNKQKTFLKS